MSEFTVFNEASILYADNYFLIERLERIFKKDQTELFQTFHKMIQEKKWMDSGEWKIYISGTYFELRYQTDQGKEPFTIYMIFGPRDLANKNNEEGKEGDRRSFEIALAAREDVGNLKEFRKKFFKKAEAVLNKQFEMGRHYHPNRTTGTALVKKGKEFSLSNILNAMETEMENFVNLSEYARQSL
jgi:hypothetical protein